MTKTRADQVDAAARALLACLVPEQGVHTGYALPNPARLALDAALALPPDPPAPVGERERAIVLAAVKLGGGYGIGATFGGVPCVEYVIASVDATHPRQSDERAAVIAACTVLDEQRNAGKWTHAIWSNATYWTAQWGPSSSGPRATFAEAIMALAALAPTKPVVSAGRYPFVPRATSEEIRHDVSGLVRPGDPGGPDRVGDDGPMRDLPAPAAEVSADPSAPSVQGGGHVETGLADSRIVSEYRAPITTGDGAPAAFQGGGHVATGPPPDPTAKIVARLRARATAEGLSANGLRQENRVAKAQRREHAARALDEVADEIEREAKGGA